MHRPWRHIRKPPIIQCIVRERTLFYFIAILVIVWVGAYLLFFSTINNNKSSQQTRKNTLQTDTKEPPTSALNSQHDSHLTTIQIAEEHVTSVETSSDQIRQNAIKEAFVHTWNGYVKYAWGADELHPVSNDPGGGWGNLGVTIVDSLDTILIMGLTEQFQKAREFVETLNFKKSYDASTFETTIRYLGGLLSAYDMTDDSLFLNKAVQLAELLLPAFNSPSGIPYSTVNLESGKAWNPSWNGETSSLSEFGSLQLEFRYLSHMTGKMEFAEKVNHINDLMSMVDVDMYYGLFPISYHPVKQKFIPSKVTFGARGDSFYEYLLKQYLQTNKSEEKLWKMYIKSMDGLKNKLIRHSTPSNLTYIVEMLNNDFVPKMDHLACFVPGMLALDGIPDHLELAKEIMYTCYQFYERNPSGLAPEIAYFKDGVDFINDAPHYLLRPETVESLFILYRVTGDKKYQEWGWKIFQALEKNCKTESGFSGLVDVGLSSPTKNNRMESFFMAETLKYLFLLFSVPSTIPLEDFVFNTEAHPLRKF